MMEEGIGKIPEHLTTAIVNNLYERGTEHLQTRVSYILQNENLHHHDWVISRSIITQRGSEDDKSYLLASKHFNRPRPVGQKRREPNQQNAVAPEQQPAQRQRRGGPHAAQPMEEAASSSSDDD